MNRLAIVLLVIIGISAALPLEEEEEEVFGPEDVDEDSEEYGDYIEGDMILDEDQLRANENPNQRNGLVAVKYRWPGNTVYYKISSVFGPAEIQAIEQALRTISSHTCIRFKKKTPNTRDYIFVTGDPTGCHSQVGRHTGKQILNLRRGTVGHGCFKIGTIMHEFVHALGFYHQQSAPDRDSFVKIYTNNIKPESLKNFVKMPVQKATQFGVQYDYNSIMHYSSTAFSKNGKKTIVPMKASAVIGQRKGLSRGDIKKINMMYGCKV